jgi:hypothetical protein
MSLFSLNEQAWRTESAPSVSGRAQVRNGQNLSKPKEATTTQL